MTRALLALGLVICSCRAQGIYPSAFPAFAPYPASGGPYPPVAAAPPTQTESPYISPPLPTSPPFSAPAPPSLPNIPFPSPPQIPPSFVPQAPVVPSSPPAISTPPNTRPPPFIAVAPPGPEAFAPPPPPGSNPSQSSTFPEGLPLLRSAPASTYGLPVFFRF